MAKVIIFRRMNLNIEEIGRRIILMGSVFTHGVMVVGTKAIGNKIICMVKELTLGKMVVSI